MQVTSFRDVEKGDVTMRQAAATAVCSKHLLPEHYCTLLCHHLTSFKHPLPVGYSILRFHHLTSFKEVEKGDLKLRQAAMERAEDRHPNELAMISIWLGFGFQEVKGVEASRKRR